MGAAILALTCYESLNIFYYAGPHKFLPYSAIFLNLNFLILAVVFFIQKIQKSQDIEDFLTKYFPEKNQKEIDRKREGALINEIEAQKKDDTWKCTFPDLSDVITPIQVRRSDFEDQYFSKVKKFQLLTILKVALILASFIVLIFYAFILYQVDNGDILGIIIAISVTCLDLFNILRAYNQESHRNTVVYLMLNRVLLVFLGDSMWIYGCMIVYLIYGSDLVLQIAQRRFPFDQDIFEEKSKGIYPSILLLILSVMYCSLLYVVQYVEWSGKKDQKLIFNHGLNELGVGLGSVITVAIMFTVYLVVSIARMFIRKAQKTVKASGYDQLVKRFTNKNGLFTILNFFIVLVYICIVGLFSIFYALSKDISLIIWGVFLPAIVIAYSYGFTYFCLNEYHYFQDVTRLNKTIDAHNIKIGQLEKRKETLAKQIADKTLFVDDDSAPAAKLDISQKLVLKNNLVEDFAKFKELVKTNYTKKKSQYESLLKNEEGREQDLEASKVYINIDEAEREDDGLRKIAENRLQRVKDWRKETNIISALLTGKLRPNDKGFIYSMIVALIAWFGLFVGLTSTQAAYKGTAIALLYLGVSLVISSSVIQQSRALTVKELIPWIVFNLIYIGASLTYFFLSFDGVKSSPEGLRYIFYYILTLPTVIHGIILLIRVFTKGFQGLFVEFKLFIAIFLIGKLSMIIMSFFISPITGGIYFSIVVLVGSALRISFVYRQNGELTRFQTIGSLILAAIIVVIPTLIAIFDKNFSMFQGFSSSGLLFFLMICIYSLGSWIQDLREKDLKPIYCSRFIFPIYKFDVIKKDFVPHNAPTILWFFGLLILLLLSFFISFVIETIWEGAFLSILIESLILLSAMLFSSTTFGLINDVNILMNEVICKQSWLQVKKIFFKENGIFSSGSRDSYRRLWKHEFFLHGYQKLLNGSQPNSITSNISKELAEEIQKELASGENLKNIYQKKIKDIFPDLEGQLEDKAKINKFLLELQDRLKATYQKELILLIRFLIIAIQNFKSVEETEQKTFLRFLNEKADIFQVFGIRIIISKHLSIDSQYRQAKQQIAELEVDKKKRFDEIEEATKLEKQIEAEKSGKTRADDKQRHEERQKELEENVKQKEKELKNFEETSGSNSNLDLSLDPNTLPDCLKKYQLIVARAQKSKTKFVDAQFPAVDKSIGQQVIQNLGRGTRAWITASEHQHKSGKPYAIFQDGVDFSDIEQGSLGDCYYLSALAVLGSEHTKQRFVFLNDEEEWKKCGAFCLKFYFDGQESIVIIDDKFLTVNNDFPFVKTPSRVEMWPMILEKAYAKFYGSYENIEGGFVHKALQELISGIPVLLANEKQTDKNQFYEKLKLYQSQGFPMGAGSPAHQDGDKATSSMGIVQGHAFSVIKLAQVDNTKLICIRNPWGQGEWTGDWSDNCPKWTARAKNLAGYTESKDDGVFWMDFNDYLKEFDEIYVCMTLTTKLGWNCLDLSDKWEGKYGYGVPSGNNRSAKLQDSPQFALTIYKPGKAHIVFRVKEKIDSNNPAVYPYLNVQDNDGQLISRPNSTKELATLGPTNLIVQTAEIEFKAGLKYPRTITILASFIPNDDHTTNEKNFRLQVYSQDDEATFKKMN